MSRNCNILIAGADRLACWGIERLIAPRRAVVTTVTTGAEVLAEIGRTHYDSLFLDMDLPDVSAAEVLGEVKQRSPQTRVVALSQEPTEDVRRLAGDHDGVHFLGKPLEIPKMTALISSLFEAAAD